MRDFINQEQGADEHATTPPDTAPATLTTRRTDAPHNASAQEYGTTDADADIDGLRYLSHPANAEPLAELLGQLQQTHGNAYVQRVVAGIREAQAGDAETSSEHVRPLDAPMRAVMESGFEDDFGDVRVHTGGRAEQSADQLGARAFTQGHDVYFGRGGFDPSSCEDRETLAHELAHVAQQRVRQDGQTAASHDAAEREADEVAKVVASGQRAQVTQTADASTVYMQATTPAQAQRTPTPPPTAQPSSQTLNLNTPAISNAIVTLLVDRAYENERIVLWAAFPQQRWRWIAQYLMLLFPAAMSELLSQRPSSVNRLDFLRTACTQIWNMMGATLVGVIDQRRAREKPFRDRTDRERQRMMTGDISAPANDEL